MEIDGFEAMDGQGGAGLVVATGIPGDLILPPGTFDCDRADEIRELAAQAGAEGPSVRISTLRNLISPR